jgi:DNA-binding LacI/PurR family transcriptional regulator
MSVSRVRETQPTLEEVGEVAGVSRATVSRVVNGSPRVSPDAKKAVERAIRKLGYTPNPAARALVTKRTDTIALVISEPETRVFSDPFFLEVVRGISSVIEGTQLQIVLLLANGARGHQKVERYVRQGHVDGVVLLSLHGADPLPRMLAKANMPTVLLGRVLGRPASIPSVDVDNRLGAREAVEHLVSLGRTTIATITGPLDMCAGVDRRDGFRDAMREAGLRSGDGLVVNGDFGEDSGYRGMERILRRHPDVDGVFAASDLMAAGALRALREAGRTVPGDVAVVGFDDAPLARHTTPPLTTMRQPMDDVARAMAELLLRQIDEGPSRGDLVVCPATLIRRESA